MSIEASPASGLFHSPIGLYDFQADGVARTYWQWTQTDEPVLLCLWETGIGKSVLAMATIAMLFEDDLVDQVLVVAEANKMLDWYEDDFPAFTELSVGLYAGTIAKRRKILLSPAQVLVTSYETGRNDICSFSPRSRSVVRAGMLTEALRGKRVAVVFDEFSRLRTRTAKSYLAWNYLLNRVLRAPGHPQPKVLALSATTVEHDPEDHYNAGRLLTPDRAGGVEHFYASYVESWDQYERPYRWKNLSAAKSDPGVTPLNALFGAVTIRKAKTDPDVIEQFPAKVENPPTRVELSPVHAELYSRIEEIFAEESVPEEVARQGFGLLRQVAGHPASLLGSSGAYAKHIVASVGAEFLTALPPTKIEAMLAWQARMAEQQTVIFTFYGQSILPYLHAALTRQGYLVSVNHGGMSKEERKTSQDAFKAGDTQVFLSSDAGARGLNLGIGSGLLHYELPLLNSIYEQRSSRIHRIDSAHPSVTIDHLLVADTVEMAIAGLCWKRNDWAEQVQEADWTEDTDPTEGVLRAADRMAMLRRMG